MFATTCKRGLSLFLAVLLCFTAVLGFGTTTAFAAGEQSDVYLVAYPREGDANLDYSGTWGHDNLQYMNGWSSGRSLFTIVRAMGSYEGNICYCILLIQIAVGSLYMFSVPRGYQDGFNQWMKQIAALCLTAFMQTSLLFLGLLTFPGNMLLGLGVMLAANEVPRIAQQFGLDSSVRVNMMSVVHATTTAVNLTRSVARATGK